MKMQITNEDVKNLTGKFIIQIDSDNENVILDDNNWGFYKEKRISFVCGLNMVGFFYGHREFETTEEFVLYFNDFISHKTQPEMITAQKGKRFHRLLTSKEIEFVCQKMKSAKY